jgi:hypothetical protein
MTSTEPTISAALYFDGEQYTEIPFAFFDRAVEIFRGHELSPVLFTAGGGIFELDDCYVLASPGGDLHLWNNTIQARGHQLVEALREGDIEYLAMDSPRQGSRDRMDWRADVTASLTRGMIYFGIEVNLECNPTAVLRRAYAIADGLFSVRYGIAYELPAGGDPNDYAAGSVLTSVAEVRAMIRNRREWAKRPRTPDNLWSDELHGARRHLSGLFRAAYPANLLSDAHVRAANLHAQPLGRLSRLDESLWLWELADDEIPQAEAMLEAKKLLVRQAS